MTRAEYRRQEKQKKPTYNFTLEQLQARIDQALEKRKDQMAKEAQDNLLETILVTALFTLNNEFEMEDEDLDRFVERFNKLYDDMLTDHVKLSDVKEWCKKHKVKLLGA